jgi:hypothetical protein
VDGTVDDPVDSGPPPGDNHATGVEKLFITIKSLNYRPEVLALFCGKR